MTPLRLTVVLESPQEQAPSMDRTGGELVEALRRLPQLVTPVPLQLGMPRGMRRLPVLGERHAALNADRLLTRFGSSPARLLGAAGRTGAVHVVDQVYAHLARLLPRDRVGVYAHDLDAFASVLDPGTPPRPAWFRALTRVTLDGLLHAGVVFHSTASVGEQLVAAGVSTDRLVAAPFGVSPTFSPVADPEADERVAALTGGRPYLLNVAGAVPRKRLDVLLDVVARLRVGRPDLRLVQVGADVLPAGAAALGDALVRPGRVDDAGLAALYRGSLAVCATSEAEGFGLPVLEALACGALVVSSDLPSVREVGGDAVVLVPVADVGAWVEMVAGLLDGRVPAPPTETRLAQAGRFTWERHARTVADAYRRLTGTGD